MLCDFCLLPQPHARYPAQSFTLTGTDPSRGIGSIGDWLACVVCHQLIQADRWHDLTARSLISCVNRQAQDLGRPLTQDERDFWDLYLRKLHAKFREYRTGPAHVLADHGRITR